MLYIRLVRKTIIIIIMTFFSFQPSSRKSESPATFLCDGPPAGTTIYGDWMQNPILLIRFLRTKKVSLKTKLSKQQINVKQKKIFNSPEGFLK